ncbi:MAG: CBS domain-containing protein [Bryobacteraceae bacterium]
MSRVQEILRDRKLFSVQAAQTVAEVARRMADLKIGAILVLERDELRGVFSERDLMTRVVLEGREPARTPVAEVMTTNIATIHEEATLEAAMESMQTRGCRHLPVMRDGRVVGFLSMRDLMNYELARKSEELSQMRAYISGAS